MIIAESSKDVNPGYYGPRAALPRDNLVNPMSASLVPLYPILVLLRTPCVTPGWSTWASL